MAQYATIQEAADYFATRLHSGSWNTFPPGDRDAALITATRHIDRLNYAGEKNAAYVYRQSLGTSCILTTAQKKAIDEAGLTQELQFPRGSDSEVPDDIKIACMELAFELINGKDPEREYENLATISQGFASVRKTLDREFNQEHVLAGIVSVLAWKYLRPYLRDGSDFRISRVS